MKSSGLWILFYLVLAGVAAFIWGTGHSLPAEVASHFSGSGEANGWMSRTSYLILMTAASVGMPLLVAFLQVGLFRGRAPQAILAHDPGFTSERMTEIREFLTGQALRFSMLLALFLGYVHGLVLRGNATQPPRLEVGPFLLGLSLFLVFTVAWVATFVVRFGGRR